MGRRGKTAEKAFDFDILKVIESNKKGIKFGDLEKKTKEDKRNLKAKGTLARHLKKLCKVGAVVHQGDLYFASPAWTMMYKGEAQYASNLDQRTFYAYLLESIMSLTAHYIALLQTIVEAPDVSSVHDMVDFFLNCVYNYDMGLVHCVWQHRGDVSLEPLIGRKFMLELAKEQPFAKVTVRGVSVR